MKQTTKLPEVKHMTAITTGDVWALADTRKLVALSGLGKPRQYLANTLAPGIFLIAGLLALAPVAMLWPHEKAARRRFVEHWVYFGELYPDDWRYDPGTKEFRAPAQKNR